MKFYDKLVFDIETGRLLQESSFEYEGRIASCGGGGQSKAAAARADYLERERTRIANEQLAMQRKTMEGISGGVDQFLSPEGMGFDPATMAALNSQALESVPAQFEDARKQLMSSMLARGGAGGALPVGGDYLRNLSQLHVGREGLKANLLRENLIKNALLKLQNRFSAANVKLGVGSQFDPSTFVQGGSSALGSRVTAAQNAETAAFAPWGALIGAAGSAAGSFLGRPPVPTKTIGTLRGCWIFQAVYGEADWRPQFVWDAWTGKWANESRAWRTALGLYLIFGELAAGIIKKVSLLRRLLYPLCERAVRRAMKEKHHA